MTTTHDRLDASAAPAAPAAPALERRHMPDSFSISLARYTNDFSTRLPETFGPQQDMAGFEPTYRNIVDYIVRITHRIWEGGTPGYASPVTARDVGYILDTYHEASEVFDDYGRQTGNAKIVADTRHTTGAFPDIELAAEEVIWAGDAAVGFHTSHRTIIRGTNDGPSKYGPATGRRIDLLVIANCVAKENRIFLEHVLYDTAALIRQMGLDPRAEARRLAAEPPAGWPRDAAAWARLRESTRPPRPLCEAQPVDGFDPDRFARDAVAALLRGGDARAFRTADLRFRGTTERGGGLDALLAHARELQDAFPGLAPQVDEVYWMGNGRDGYEVAIRWSADVTHRGGFGPAADRPVQLWGLSQQRLRHAAEGWRVTHEWMMFNEFDVMMQVALSGR